MSADAAFSDMMNTAFKGLNLGDVAGYAIVGALIFFLSGGLFRFTRANRRLFKKK